MIAYGRLDARIPRQPAHHVPRINARHGPLGQLARPADCRAKQRPFLVSRDPCLSDILIQILLKLMVAAHFVDLAALLSQRVFEKFTSVLKKSADPSQRGRTMSIPERGLALLHRLRLFRQKLPYLAFIGH